MRAPLCLLFCALTLAACADCEEDFDCPATEVCNTERGACEAFVCKKDEHCPPGRQCKDNSCKGGPAAPAEADALVIPTREPIAE